MARNAQVRRMLADRSGFQNFFREAAALISAIDEDGADQVRLKRNIHTLKGNCALFGVESVATFCHELEQRMADDADACTRGDRARLRDLWSVASSVYELLGGEVPGEGIDLDPDELRGLLEALQNRQDYSVLIAMVSAWRFERASVRIARASEQLRSIARRLGKSELEVRCEVSPPGLRLPEQRWAPFWTAFAHVLRNTIDHGIEMPDERGACGKPVPPTVRLSIREKEEGVELVIADDGRGIDWERIRTRAARLGLPHATTADLEEALYSDGVSSRDVATEMSGRGVGMGAVRETVRALGGRIHIETRTGHGTTFRFVFPGSMLPKMWSTSVQAPSGEQRFTVRSRPSIAGVLVNR